MTGDDKLTIGDINVTLGNQNVVGNIGHTVINPRVTRTLHADMKASLLRDFPRNKPVQVFGLSGNTESMAFANEIHAFLKANGYQMVQKEAMWHQFFNPPVFNIKISAGNGGKEWWVVVGPAE